MFLADIVRPRVFVELGTFYGVSYGAFCQAVKELQTGTRCFAVDTWRGDPHGGVMGDEVLHDLREHHDPLYGSFSRLMQMTFDEAAAHFEDGSIDLLHIDGFHTYEAARHDFETWLPRLSKQGVVLFHDIAERGRGFGVWRLWDEVKARYPSYEVEFGHGLGMIAVGRDYPTTLDLFFRSTSVELGRVRDCFRRLGELMEAANEAELLKREHRAHQEQATARLHQARSEHPLLIRASNFLQMWAHEGFASAFNLGTTKVIGQSPASYAISNKSSGADGAPERPLST